MPELQPYVFKSVPEQKVMFESSSVETWKGEEVIFIDMHMHTRTHTHTQIEIRIFYNSCTEIGDVQHNKQCFPIEMIIDYSRGGSRISGKGGGGGV